MIYNRPNAAGVDPKTVLTEVRDRGFVAHVQYPPPPDAGIRLEAWGATEQQARENINIRGIEFLAALKARTIGRDIQYGLPRLGRTDPWRFWS